MNSILNNKKLYRYFQYYCYPIQVSNFIYFSPHKITFMPQLLSILIPAYNEANTIHLILNKVLEVELIGDFNSEIIIVNDFSTDNTREIAQSMGARVVIADGESVCAARNSGFQNAKGDIIVFSDADCADYTEIKLEKRQLVVTISFLILKGNYVYPF